MRFVIVGGVALQLQGSSYTTFGIDLAYDRDRKNCARLAAALRPFNPRPRGWAPGLPFICDAQTLLSNDILTLETTAGDADLLGVIKGIGDFAEVERLADTVTCRGFTLLVLSIDGLIIAKTAAGRPKDLAGLMELAALREARQLADAQGDSDSVDEWKH